MILDHVSNNPCSLINFYYSLQTVVDTAGAGMVFVIKPKPFPQIELGTGTPMGGPTFVAPGIITQS